MPGDGRGLARPSALGAVFEEALECAVEPISYHEQPQSSQDLAATSMRDLAVDKEIITPGFKNSADFIRMSVRSFPLTPTWLGTHSHNFASLALDYKTRVLSRDCI